MDDWNQRILKDLPEGASKAFYHLGDLVIGDYGDAGAVQPYVNWIKDQDGVAVGRITMTGKGGAFTSGTLAASGGGDRSMLGAAIERISKKKV